MPIYTIKDKNNPDLGEWEVVSSWSDLQTYLEENPDHVQVLKPIQFVTGRKDALASCPEGFKDLKKRMHQGAGKNSRIKI